MNWEDKQARETKAKRQKPCAVCRHEGREGIERALLRGESVRRIGERFGVSPWSVWRHKTNHFGAQMAAAAQRAGQASWLLEEWHRLRADTGQLETELRAQARPEAVVRLLAFRAKLLELGQRLEQGAAHEEAAEPGAGRQWAEMQHRLLRAVSEDEQVYTKVVEAIARIEEEARLA